MERPVLGSSQRDGTSAADAMVEKIQFQKILKNLRLFVKNHSCIATFRPLPGSQQLPLVLQTTPLAPQVPPGSTPIDGGGILLFLDFRHFRPLAPTLKLKVTRDCDDEFKAKIPAQFGEDSAGLSQGGPG